MVGRTVEADESQQKRTCREKALSAGMGMRAAMKKAVTLLMEVRATLAPVLFRHSPVRSWQPSGTERGGAGRGGVSDGGERGGSQ